MRSLSIKIVSGSKTCYDFVTKSRCQHAGAARYGTTPVCMLFPSNEDNSRPGHHIPSSVTELLEDECGCVLRCAACLEAEKGEEK